MIAIDFQGQLGNQLFQYAVGRLLAERLGCGLVLDSRGGCRQALADMRRNRLSQQIFEVFPDLPFDRRSHVFNVLKTCSVPLHDWTRRRLFPRVFKPQVVPMGGIGGNEIYDPSLWDVSCGTQLSGFFQSASYYAGQEYKIRSWFQPPTDTRRTVATLLAELPATQRDMVAVHVRLGDYLLQRGGIADATTGWALPKCYYERALDRFPANAPIALFSDDCEAACAFLPRRPAWIAQGGRLGVDLFLMSSFKNIIIANSSYSWWAAWLNEQMDKVVVGPQYHLGWRQRQWYPASIMVEGWTYV